MCEKVDFRNPRVVYKQVGESDIFYSGIYGAAVGNAESNGFSANFSSELLSLIL